MIISIAVLRSSKVGDDFDMRWSNMDLQSVTTITGLVVSWFQKLVGHFVPSSASDNMREIHSHIPNALDMRCASALNVEFTTRGKRWLFQNPGGPQTHLTRIEITIRTTN